MIKKIVFFSFAPIVKHHHYKCFGVERLKDNGFEVWVYDFSPIVFTTLHSNVIHRFEKITSEDYSLFYDEKKALQAIHDLGEGCFVVVVGYYQLQTFKIFRALSKRNIPYATLATTTDPCEMGVPSQESLLLKLLLKIKRFNLNRSLALKTLLFKPLMAPVLGIRSPNICILGGEKSLESNKKYALVGKNTELLWAHVPDYDTYLNDLHKKEAEEDIAIFIEPTGPMFTWDDHLPNADALWSINEYYPSHCRFFDYLEQELKLEVIIAGHPKSNHDTDRPEYYGKRQVISNQILPLIKKSKLVMTANSMALSLIALEKKPVLILTNAAFERDVPFSRCLKLIATSFGRTPVNVDKLPYSIDWQKELLVNEDLYLSYQQHYVKKAASEKLNSWQILANRLKQSNF
jgi:hypothetical protein